MTILALLWIRYRRIPVADGRLKFLEFSSAKIGFLRSHSSADHILGFVPDLFNYFSHCAFHRESFGKLKYYQQARNFISCLPDYNYRCCNRIFWNDFLLPTRQTGQSSQISTQFQW